MEWNSLRLIWKPLPDAQDMHELVVDRDFVQCLAISREFSKNAYQNIGSNQDALPSDWLPAGWSEIQVRTDGFP